MDIVFTGYDWSVIADVEDCLNEQRKKMDGLKYNYHFDNENGFTTKVTVFDVKKEHAEVLYKEFPGIVFTEVAHVKLGSGKATPSDIVCDIKFQTYGVKFIDDVIVFLGLPLDWWDYELDISTGEYTVTLFRCGFDDLNRLSEKFPNTRFKLVSRKVVQKVDVIKKTILTKALDFLDNVKSVLQEKNKAYGDSAASPLRIFSKSDSDEGIKVRIDDKLSRIARGDGSGDEDAIKDLVGYLAFLAGGKLEEAVQFLDDVKKDLETTWGEDPNLSNKTYVFAKTPEERIRADLDLQLEHIVCNSDELEDIGDIVFDLALLAGTRK